MHAIESRSGSNLLFQDRLRRQMYKWLCIEEIALNRISMQYDEDTIKETRNRRFV